MKNLMLRRRRCRRKTNDENENERRKAKDERRRSKKNSRKKLKNVFKTNVSSQNHRMKKEEGATVDSSAIFYPTFPQRAASSFRRAVGSVLQQLPKQWERVINYRKCPNYETNVKRKT